MCRQPVALSAESSVGKAVAEKIVSLQTCDTLASLLPHCLPFIMTTKLSRFYALPTSLPLFSP